MVCKKCGKEFKTVKKIDGKMRNISNREYCLECVPFGKRFKKDPRKCERCGHETIGQRRLCSSCTQTIRRYLAKKAGVQLLGGKCTRCNFNEDTSALEFHHPDENKEYMISSIYNKSWDFIKKEIEKCTLLCSNCHRITHTGFRDEKFLELAKNYKGKLSAVVV